MISREPMIGNVRKALDYHRRKMEAGKAEVLQRTFVSLDYRHVNAELQMVQGKHCYLGKKAYHVSLNFHPEESISNEKMLKIARDYMGRYGFGAHPHVIVRHYDAEHPHVHILVSRTGFDESLVEESFNYKRAHAICQELEKIYDLRPTPLPELSMTRGITIGEMDMFLLRDKPSTKWMLQIAVGDILEKNPSFNAFVLMAEEKGVSLQFRLDVAGSVTGITYGYEGKFVTGKGLGNAFKWKNMAQKLQFDARAHERLIHRCNERTAQRHGKTKEMREREKQQQAERNNFRTLQRSRDAGYDSGFERGR